ncbi:AAA family ATPase [Streptomyces sp. NPDC052225]|uniref:ATP-binding protein n=1 Tax=Streptomyces sp. NPDC052225 TaxID=3154949 RepID=UPI00343E746F
MNAILSGRPTEALVGRADEGAALAGELGDARLVTVRGAAGIGKSALAAAAAAGADRPVRRVDLAGLREPALVPHALARALRVADEPDRDMLDAVARAVGRRAVLLLVDTCEHLVDAVAACAQRLLADCPRLCLLTTSRAALGVGGERVIPLEPLTEAGSQALLVARAPFMSGASGRTRRLLGERLGGLPLAVELAARQLRRHTTGEVLGALAAPGGLLGLADETTRRRPVRHRSMRAAVGWSHALCDPQERLLWARLAVFPGPFTARRAAEVCADRLLPERDVPVALGGLVRASVVRRAPDAFELGPAEAQFGLESLRSVPGQETVMRRRERNH